MTAAINSRSSVLSSLAEEVETPQRQPAVAPPPPRKPSNDNATNQVERWSGQAGGAPGARTTTEVLAEIEKKMGKNTWGPVRDFWVTERDARDCVALLGQLPPAEYKKALDTMGVETQGRLYAEMDPDTRDAFFVQAQTKGLLKEEAGVKLPTREGSPPDKPALLRNDPSLPMELRKAIHEVNKARTAQYMHAFDAYVTRYSEAALKAESPLSLRMMGPPMGEFVLNEPGVTASDRGFPHTLEQGATTRVRAAKAANDRISDFAGRARAGSFSATLEAKVKVGVGHFESEATYKASQTGYGKFEGKLKAEVQAELLHGASAGASSSGERFGEVKVGDFRVRSEGGRVNELEGIVGRLGVSLSEGKSTLSMGSGLAPIGAFTTLNDQHGSYGGGLKLGGEQHLGSVSVEASVKLGVMVQGIAPERLPDIASMKNDGIWGPMPELDQRVKWGELPQGRRERLARDGWSASSWPIR